MIKEDNENFIIENQKVLNIIKKLFFYIFYTNYQLLAKVKALEIYSSEL